MKLHNKKSTVLNAEGKFSQSRDHSLSPAKLAQLDITELSELSVQMLNDECLPVSKARPFFWNLVETYVDRFEHYPFNASKALFNDLELKGYPEDMVKKLVKQLEVQYERTHGRALHKSTELMTSHDDLDDEIKRLRDSLKYAALVAEVDD